MKATMAMERRRRPPHRYRWLTPARIPLIVALLGLLTAVVNLLGNYVKPALPVPTIIVVTPLRQSVDEPGVGATGRWIEPLP